MRRPETTHTKPPSRKHMAPHRTRFEAAISASLPAGLRPLLPIIWFPARSGAPLRRKQPLCRGFVALSALHPPHPGRHVGAPSKKDLPPLGQLPQTAKVAGVGDVGQRVLSDQVPP